VGAWNVVPSGRALTRRKLTYPLLSVVIPVYNEGEPFLNMLESLAARLQIPCEILVVFDMDEDTTVAPTLRFAKTHPFVKLVKNRYGRGASQAIRTGLDAATGAGVLVTMADLSDDLDAIPAFLDAFEKGADLVCGSRYMPGGSQKEGPLLKRTLSRMAGLLLYRLRALPVHDATNSFKLYRKTLLDRLTIESDTGFTIGFEILVKAHLLGATVAEVPTSYKERTTGTSNFRVFAWLPAYLRWFFIALFGSKRDSAG